jgi:calcineurin-like phosphoesterase family protein
MTRFVNRFVISDHHLGHTNSWEKFKLADGSPLRPFTSTEEMNETMIERHNAKVKEQDTVYFLGDVVINKRYLELVKRMNGRKILVRGNHDIFGDDDYYSVGFEQIHGVRVFVDKFILSHIPLHPDCVTERFRVNVHGHLHANQVMRPGMKQWIEKQTKTLGTIEYETDVFRADYSPEPDPRYLCVCVEQTDYTPIHFDEVEKRIQQRWENAEYTGPVKAWGNGSGPN